MPQDAQTSAPKTIYTREAFEELRQRNAAEMSADEELQRDALDVFQRADKKYWAHQMNWLGEPVLNLAQDMFAIQEVMYRTRPDYVVEVGAAWGGSLLFYSTLMETLGGKGVIAVDIFIPDDLRQRVGRHGSVSERITWIEGSSTDDSTLAKIRAMVGDDAQVLVILDSDHTHDHVLKELQMYSPLVQPGQYIICCDGIVENIAPNELRPRPWGPGNNPLTAIRQFMDETDRFEVDTGLENKLLFTCNPNGYLRCVR